MFMHKKNQRGAALVLFAVMVPVLIAMMGLVFDLGQLYFKHTEARNVADNVFETVKNMIKTGEGKYTLVSTEPSEIEKQFDSYSALVGYVTKNETKDTLEKLSTRINDYKNTLNDSSININETFTIEKVTNALYYKVSVSKTYIPLIKLASAEDTETITTTTDNKTTTTSTIIAKFDSDDNIIGADKKTNDNNDNNDNNNTNNPTVGNNTDVNTLKNDTPTTQSDQNKLNNTMKAAITKDINPNNNNIRLGDFSYNNAYNTNGTYIYNSNLYANINKMYIKEQSERNNIYVGLNHALTLKKTVDDIESDYDTNPFKLQISSTTTKPVTIAVMENTVRPIFIYYDGKGAITIKVDAVFRGIIYAPNSSSITITTNTDNTTAKRGIEGVIYQKDNKISIDSTANGKIGFTFNNFGITDLKQATS